MAKYYCKNCGKWYSDLRTLLNNRCPRHPDGGSNHELYEGDEKSSYVCKYCGRSYRDIASMTLSSCPKHPKGAGKGHHSPSL